jgi:hypothetical protein
MRETQNKPSNEIGASTTSFEVHTRGGGAGGEPMSVECLFSCENRPSTDIGARQALRYIREEED